MTFDEDYFFGAATGNLIPGGYSNYSTTAYSLETAPERASRIIAEAAVSGIDLIGGSVLVIGCAFGILMDALIKEGVNAYGIDISNYAIRKSLLGANIIFGNATDPISYILVKQMAGVESFDLIVDENMICCLTDEEAVSAFSIARQHTSLVMHLVQDNPSLAEWYNFHTPAEWKILLGNDRWFKLNSWEES